MGPLTTQQTGRAIPFFSFCGERCRAAFLRSVGSVGGSVGMFSVQSSHTAPYRVLGDQNDCRVGCLTFIFYLIITILVVF